MDCDAFYASVEKRDNPELRDKAVIVGGGTRGVVSTCCYLARIHGVHSAMPMFQALKLCPEAVVVKPRMAVYAEASRAIRALMEVLTPAIEPLSLDEAFLDLTGTTQLHGAPPAVLLARLLRDMEQQLGLSGSVGLSHNKFLAKIASDLDKPRGFSVIGRRNRGFRRNLLSSGAWLGYTNGAGKSGHPHPSDLLHWDRRRNLLRGLVKWEIGSGILPVVKTTAVLIATKSWKSISKETTFFEDTSNSDLLDGHLWRLSEQVAVAKSKALAGGPVTLKLKKSDFQLVTRRQTLPSATQLTDMIYRMARELFDHAGVNGPSPLTIGVGLSDLVNGAEAEAAGDLLDPNANTRAAAERATDAIRSKFGTKAIFKGRALR